MFEMSGYRECFVPFILEVSNVRTFSIHVQISHKIRLEIYRAEIFLIYGIFMTVIKYESSLFPGHIHWQTQRNVLRTMHYSL
jgi:hypothetical protein